MFNFYNPESFYCIGFFSVFHGYCTWLLEIQEPHLRELEHEILLHLKNALSNGFHTLLALTSHLAPSALLAPAGSSLPLTGMRRGSMVTSLQPAVSKSSANTSLNELWRRDTYPPLLHINEWFIKLSFPHTHFLAASFIPKLYLRAKASN